MGFNMKVNNLVDLEHFTRHVQKQAVLSQNKERASSICSLVELLQNKKIVETALQNITKIEVASLKRGENVSSGSIFEAKKCAIGALNQIKSSLSKKIMQVFPGLDVSSLHLELS